ncbi:hypothetical protein [Streptosporangium sp. CA-115845]
MTGSSWTGRRVRRTRPSDLDDDRLAYVAEPDAPLIDAGEEAAEAMEEV